MPKPRDAVKERYWRKLIRRFESSGLGARRFCDKVGVPQHRFHWWRRRLRWRDHREAAGVDSHDTDAAQASSAVAGKSDSSAFLPVRLPFSLGSWIEVVHPRGYVIRVPSVFDANALQRVLVALETPDDSP